MRMYICIYEYTCCGLGCRAQGYIYIYVKGTQASIEGSVC